MRQNEDIIVGQKCRPENKIFSELDQVHYFLTYQYFIVIGKRLPWHLRACIWSTVHSTKKRRPGKNALFVARKDT